MPLQLGREGEAGANRMFGNSGNAGEQNAKRQDCAVQWKNGDWDFITIIHPAHKSLREFINEPSPYIEIVDGAGARFFVQKLELVRIEPDMRGKEQAHASKAKSKLDLGRFDSEDPSVVLSLAPGAPEEQVRAAYLEIAKRLHPDRLATLDLPKEVAAIAGLLMAKVNVAYRALMDQAQSRRAA
jgi:hypothetical protein